MHDSCKSRAYQECINNCWLFPNMFRFEFNQIIVNNIVMTVTLYRNKSACIHKYKMNTLRVFVHMCVQTGRTISAKHKRTCDHFSASASFQKARVSAHLRCRCSSNAARRSKVASIHSLSLSLSLSGPMSQWKPFSCARCLTSEKGELKTYPYTALLARNTTAHWRARANANRTIAFGSAVRFTHTHTRSRRRTHVVLVACPTITDNLTVKVCLSGWVLRCVIVLCVCAWEIVRCGISCVRVGEHYWLSDADSGRVFESENPVSSPSSRHHRAVRPGNRHECLFIQTRVTEHTRSASGWDYSTATESSNG